MKPVYVSNEDGSQTEFPDNRTNPKPIKVLVIDAHLTDRALLCAQLKSSRTQAYQADEAENIDAALALLGKQIYDCVLLDYFLPDRDDLSSVRLLRQACSDEQLPVILVSHLSEDILQIAATKSNAIDFLVKDQINIAALDHSIATALTKAQLQRSTKKEGKELSEVNGELLRKYSDIQTLYQSISHELKNPLAAIREFTSLLADGVAGKVNPQQEEFLNISLECCDRLNRLVNDLLDTAKLETGKLSLIPDWVELAPLAHVVAKQHLSCSAKKNVSLTWDLPAGLPKIQGDSVRIAQVISNLIDNSLKFTDAGGWVRVSVTYQRRSQCLKLTVADNGKGIASKDVHQIFDRMYQSESNGQAQRDGLGIGLFLSATIAKLHGGSLQVQSEVGVGSEFILSLPLIMPTIAVTEMPKPSLVESI